MMKHAGLWVGVVGVAGLGGLAYAILRTKKASVPGKLALTFSIVTTNTYDETALAAAGANVMPALNKCGAIQASAVSTAGLVKTDTGYTATLVYDALFPTTFPAQGTLTPSGTACMAAALNSSSVVITNVVASGTIAQP